MRLMSHAPCRALGLAPSFGFGDRIGLATPGHISAMRMAGSGIEPIFPQQSIREMERTGRSPAKVLEDALSAMRRAGWQEGTGADADHLKTADDVRVTVAAGFTFFTIDPSDHVDRHTESYDEATLRARYQQVGDPFDWCDRYAGHRMRLDTGREMVLDDEDLVRAVVKYGLAARHAIDLTRHIDTLCGESGREYEIELSVDETPHATSLTEHYLLAHECLQAGMRLVSLAPRLPGDFEKGVDYKGDIDHLERALEDHAAVARQLGPYKLSLHSGSDKLSIYPLLARITRGQFHVKTAGTSYLEALRVVARHDPQLLREIIDFARTRYESDRATYHLSASLRQVPAPADIAPDADLERIYLGDWGRARPGCGLTEPGRQIIHCTFGSVLTDSRLRPRLRDLLTSHAATYEEVLADHFGRHLRALGEGM
ncbi:MAG: tagaturonate epimerase family protein [Pirellulales bacterium]